MRYAPVDPTLFITNRSRLARGLKSKAIAILHASDVSPTSGDGTRPFIQQTDFFYLCGIDQADCILVICPDAVEEKHREMLFIPETNAEIALWEGEKYSQEEARTVSGVRTVYWTGMFEKILRPLLIASDHIYLNTNEHLRADTAVESRDRRFIDWCQRSFPLHHYQRLAPLMRDLRIIKSEMEISLISRACGITEKGFRRLFGFIRPGVWEFEIEAEIVHEYIRNRSRGPAFEPIVASGANSCVLHYVKNHHQCREGDLVLIDTGAEYANYAADVTRTIPVDGRFTPRQRDVYESVLRIQRAAIQELHPGITLDQYQRQVGEYMEGELVRLGLLQRGEVKRQSKDDPLYRKYFMHGVSHHLGLDVHDNGDRNQPLSAGMVLTCEPGIYIREEGFGIRLENDILLTATGPVDLTRNIPIEPDEIEELMNRRS
ncbi:MAG: aminopeptidase P N-terminal domain-containing protein [Thermodesulfobacteriota bacterium]